jgi:hypothetical protein
MTNKEEGVLMQQETKVALQEISAKLHSALQGVTLTPEQQTKIDEVKAKIEEFKAQHQEHEAGTQPTPPPQR